MARKKKKETYELREEYKGEPGVSKFLIRINESVDFNTKHDGTIIDSNVSGKLSVINNGSKDRIWDIDIELEGIEKTSLKSVVYHIPELEPKQEWTQEYNIKISAKEEPPVKIMEYIDVFPTTEEESHTFILDKDSKGNVTNFKITMENTSDGTVTDIILTKEIIDDFRDVKISSEGKGRARYDDNKISWVINEIEPNETTELSFNVKVYPTVIKNYSSGEINIQYVLESGTYSGLKTRNMDGLSENIYFLERDERDQEPDVWDCQFSFNNRSEFPLLLLKFMFIFGDENTEFETITEDPNVVVNPKQEWISDTWDITSEDEPTCSEYVLYTVEPKIEEVLSMSSTIQPIELKVMALEGTKEFSLNELKSYRKTTLDVLIDIVTRGKAPIDIIHMEDTIPTDFSNPEKEDFEIKIEGKVIPDDDYSFTFEPAGDDISRERKMHIEIKDILENIGELDDETSIVAKYPLDAVKPARDARYDAPVLFQAYIKDSNVPIETYIEPKPITVVHERRRTRIGKSIKPSTEVGIYNILLLYQNRGDSIKTEVKVSDFVPNTFTVLESDTEYEEKSEKEGSRLTWIIEEINPGEEIEIKYSIQGEGDDYTLKNIEARAFK